MGLFDNVLHSDQTLVKNEAALDYEFLPKIIPFRENEQQYLASSIKPLFQGRSGRNLLIYGAPGIGKSAATRAVLRELEEQTDEIHIIYVNCWQHNTSYKVFVEICEQIGYKFTQNKKTPDLQKVATTIINKTSAVVVFDEIDKAEDVDFLYVLLENIYHKSLFLLTNYKSWLIRLDERIRSRLMPELVEFRQYSPKETEGILKSRLGYAFFDNVWPEDAFKMVSKKTSAIKDIRSGLFLLKESAHLAEEESSKKISIDNVTKAIQKLEDFSIKTTEDLEEEEQAILAIVRGNSGKKIGDLFRIYEEQGGKNSYKTFQRKIAKLNEGKYIKVTKKTGAGGNTTIIEKKITDF